MSNARARGRDVFGLLLLDKPAGASSNHALQRVKHLYQAARAGHTGSLDPLATGMLPILFGSGTRLCGYLLDSGKEYSTTARLGIATTTGDAEGEVIADRSGEAPPSLDAVADVLRRFVGEISQVPPMYSALKRDGVPLYSLARRGIEVERAPRRVTIEALVLEEYRWPHLALTVRCSKGTYIRTLVEDIAVALGTVGHVAALRRLAVLPFVGQPMHSLDSLQTAATAGGLNALDAFLLPPDLALPDWPAVELDGPAVTRLSQGQAVPAEPNWPRGEVRVYAQPRRFIALGTVTTEGRLEPQRVFRS
ncbi:MAG: tRNA pseudouridine(55) synthase TruB [Gammaproteobacteria bacterium]